jgi:hypothetical protein
LHISVIEGLLLGVSGIAALAQAYILRALVLNKLRSAFKTFFFYNVACIVATLVAVGPFIYFCTQYFYIFWVLNVLLMILEFGVLFEVFNHALKPYAALIDLGKILFRWAAVFLLIAGLLTAVATSGSGGNKILAATHLMQRSLRLMQCGLLLLFFSLEKRLGLSWRSYSMSIALGLGVYAATDLVVSYLRVQLPAWTGALDVLANSIYLGAAIFWAACFARPEPARKSVLDSPSKLIFQRWNEALLAAPLVTQERNAALASVDSFLPGIEKTVDRVLARKLAN